MTKINELENWIQAAQDRLEQLQKNASDGSSASPEIMAELSVNIEELHVAVEELHQQNEELLATRRQLEQERQRYLELFDFAPNGYIVTDRKATIQEANYSAAQLLNIPQKYLPGKPLDVLIAQADQKVFNSQWQDMITRFAQAWETASRDARESDLNVNYATGNLIQDWEVQFQPRQGEPIPVALSLSITCNAEGEWQKLLWLIRDLRDSKQAEAKIRQQAALLDAATDAIWVQDLEGKILYWNQGAENTYGWTAAEAVDQYCHRLLFKPTASDWRKARQTSRKRQQWQGELQNLTKAGEEILVESHWTLVPDLEDLPPLILMVDSNITEKKQLEQQLFQAQRLESLGTLAGGIAHDMNNILSPIIPISQLLIRKFPNLDDHSREMLQMIERSGRRGAALVKQILGFARGMDGTRTMIQLPSLIEEITQIVTETFPRSIEFRSNVPNNLWAIYGDQSQLYQILLNMTINARDAMAEGGILSLSAENLFGDERFAQIHPGAEVGPYVAIAISDTGMGITAENLDRIFDPFFTTKEVGKGTGLGLSTVAGIVKSHGGFIDVSSQVGEGTQFRVFLPAVGVAEPTRLEAEETFQGNGELILVVDDEAAICQMNHTVLETYGYRVLTTENGQAGVELYLQHQSDIRVVLMDMMMPLMDGATAIDRLREINPQVQIIATSGLINGNQITESVGNAVKACLPKPYSSEALLSTLQDVLA